MARMLLISELLEAQFRIRYPNATEETIAAAVSLVTDSLNAATDDLSIPTTYKRMRQIIVCDNTYGAVDHANAAETAYQLRELLGPPPDEVEDNVDEDLGGCGYYARYVNLPGHDPDAICMQTGICWEAGEPLCVTCEPSGGWPSIRKLMEELRDE